MGSQKKICLVFLGNPFKDSRLTNLADSLRKDNCDVSIIGFDWFENARNFTSKKNVVHKLRRRPSILFYSSFALLLIKELMKTNSDIYFAEDFFTLPIVTLFAKVRKAKLYYNSREIYAFIGGLAKRPLLQKFITSIEKFFIKYPDIVLTTGEMDSEFLEKFYGIKNMLVIRNIPLYQQPIQKVNLREMYGIGEQNLILLYQGIITQGRGISFILEALQKLPDVYFIILGDGQKKEYYKQMAIRYKVDERVIFVGQIDQRELIDYTTAADVGLSLIENISVSYYHALPNKLFEYIMAGLPVLSSDLPQMKKIVDNYKVGECIELKSADEIVDVINRWSKNPQVLESFKSNCAIAAKELNWQEEYKRTRNKLIES